MYVAKNFPLVIIFSSLFAFKPLPKQSDSYSKNISKKNLEVLYNKSCSTNKNSFNKVQPSEFPSDYSTQRDRNVEIPINYHVIYVAGDSIYMNVTVDIDVVKGISYCSHIFNPPKYPFGSNMKLDTTLMDTIFANAFAFTNINVPIKRVNVYIVKDGPPIDELQIHVGNDDFKVPDEYEYYFEIDIPSLDNQIPNTLDIGKMFRQ